MSRREHIAKLEQELETSRARGPLPNESFEEWVRRQLEMSHNIASWKAYDKLLPEVDE